MVAPYASSVILVGFNIFVNTEMSVSVSTMGLKFLELYPVYGLGGGAASEKSNPTISPQNGLVYIWDIVTLSPFLINPHHSKPSMHSTLCPTRNICFSLWLNTCFVRFFFFSVLAGGSLGSHRTASCNMLISVRSGCLTGSD